ncbi:HEPN domain-containing protein [Streptomyces sp. NPDC053048]|uniref:HEPN domain-containing protein n=1 Tax=Streptomyces sp. NPDC053048 TaxID=3365694 RepID=UPI0037D83A1E
MRALISAESVYQDPPAQRELPIVSGLRGACTVLTVAAFEKFLRDLFEEELDEIRKHGIPVSALPAKLRTEAAITSLELAIKGDRSSRGADREQRFDGILAAVELLSRDSFNPKALAATHSNPDSACVKRMFKAVGMADVFQKVSPRFLKLWGRPEVSGFEAQKLDGLLDSRHQVAHTAQALHISRQELTYNVRFIEVLAQCLQEALADYVTEIIGSTT